MSRWIDADALVIDYYDDYETKDDIYTYAYVSKFQIDSAPSIDIVRCEECKFKRLYDEGDTKYYYCALEDRPNRQWSIDETDFCSWGERIEP